ASAGPKRLSQRDFGEIFGVAGSTIQSWLSGSIPETPKLVKIAAMLDWSLDDLVIYLQTGQRPRESVVDKMIYHLNYLPTPGRVQQVVQAGVNRIAAEATGKYLSS
ncbi:MAG: helix-turn-helix transcriptional regulator, partial [Leptolyngbyaceae cyanobacterium SM2_3_12]|nr:helix-turn-helix transcriptional regulator [Leptolyngbyaceae cyanobacterium SM2_3_12]